MDYLTDEQINQFISSHQVLISWIKSFVWPMVLVIVGKVAAIVYAGNPSNSFFKMIENTFGKVPVENK